MTSLRPHRPPLRYLPGKPDAETGFWLTVCGAAGLSGLILTTALVQVVIR